MGGQVGLTGGANERAGGHCPPLCMLKNPCAQHTGLVDSHLGVLSEHLIFPYSFGQLGHSACGFSDAPAKVVGDV